MQTDLILDASHALAYEEILTYINEPGLSWWKQINAFIQEKYQSSPKVTYSKCSAQKGWNVKYQKSGKSLCTLYPQKDNFIILLVMKLETLDMVENMSSLYEEEIMEMIKTARPFNGTKWLMIPVNSAAVLKNVQDLLVFKQEMNTNKKTGKKSN